MRSMHTVDVAQQSIRKKRGIPANSAPIAPKQYASEGGEERVETQSRSKVARSRAG